MADDRSPAARKPDGSAALSSRSLIWIGLALAGAAALLDPDALSTVFAGRPLPETPAFRAAGRLAQALLFAGGIAVLRARRSAASPFPLLRLCGAAAALLGMEAAALLFAASRGSTMVLMAGATVGLLLLALHGGVSLLWEALGSRRPLPGAAGPLLAVASLAVSAAGLEGLLAALARRAPPQAAGTPRLVMPEALARRETQVDGARAAWWWQGHLHLFDAEGFRRSTPLPPKAPGTFRIVAVGDSLTYGYGVAAEQAWPAQLEHSLGGEFRVEVLNLGVCGAQSEEVLGTLRRFLPRVQPDLVLYGVCLNDFLPAGRGEYGNNRAWRVDLPGGNLLEARTRIGALVAEGYDRLLMRAGVRADFMTDILRDFRGYRRRFARDAAAMNRFVVSRGLPPIIALVLNQSPADAGPGREIGDVAERSLREAGMNVIPAEYLRLHAGRNLSVSRWEGHPNAEAHRIFAGEFLASVRRDPRLEAFRLEGAPDGRRDSR